MRTSRNNRALLSSPTQRRPWFGAWILVASLAGCGGDGGLEPAHAGSRHRRLVLSPAVASEHEPRSQIVASFRAAEAPGWEIEGGDASLCYATREDRESPRVLQITGEKSVRLVVPGPFEAEAFNQVAVTLISPNPLQGVRVETIREGAGRRTPARVLTKNLELVTVRFDIETPRSADLAVDELAVEFLAEKIHVRVLSVDLIRKPWRAWLGSAEGGTLAAGGEARSAVLLSSLVPLVAELDCEPGWQLELSYCRPPALIRAVEHPVLRVRIEGGNGTAIERELSAAQEPGDPPRWQRATIPLEEIDGPGAVARFEVATAEGDAGESIFALGEVALTRRAPGAPTVVLVTSDTHRADHIGAAELGVDVRTPFLDELASRGVYFGDCVSSSNVTRPSHVSIMTAISPRDTGVNTNVDSLSEGAWTLAEAFRSAGFATYAAVSAGHLGRRQSGMRQGFDRVTWPEERPRGSEQTVAELQHWLGDAEGLPLFVWLHLFDAHTPYEPGEPYDRLYYPADKDPRDPALPELSYQARRQHREHRWLRGVRDTEYIQSLYKGEVTRLDDSLGRLFEEPRLRDAIVAVTADHGESLTAHGVYYGHTDLYPDSLHVPLILAWPGGPQGLRVERPVQNTDVGRTLLDLAGLLGVEFPGSNLMTESDPEPRFAISSAGFSAAVFDSDRLLILQLRARSVNQRDYKAHSIEMYDLADDPGCLHDLARERPEETRALRRQLVEWLMKGSKERLLASSGVQYLEDVQQLAALGYATEVAQPESSQWFDAGCDCAYCRE